VGLRALRRGAALHRGGLQGQPRRWVADQAARFPQRKALEEFDFAFQRSVKRQVVEHLGQLDFLHAKESVVLLGAADPGSHCTSASTH
jgi:DNA replication protein DnaC